MGEDHTLPAVHALHLADVVERRGVARGALFEAIARDEAELSRPRAALSMQEVEALVLRAIELTDEPGLGVHVGLLMRASAHGHLGFAAMTARSVREGLAVAIEFAPTRTRALSLRLDEEGERAALVIEERADFGKARETVVTALLVGIWQIGQALTGRELVGHAEVAFERPTHYARFAPFMKGMVRFGRDDHRLVFAPDVLDMPLQMSDPGALELALEQCRQELDDVSREPPTVRRVRALFPAERGPPPLEEAARQLHVSARTLKRKLASEGASYGSLRDAHREQLARRLLRSPELSIELIADRLGYAEPASFTRAFRRWTGTSPSAYRALGDSPESS